MAVSEIDDIFSGKTKSTKISDTHNSKKRKASEEGQASTSKTTLDVPKKKKKKKKATPNPPDEKAESRPALHTQKDAKETRVVETVLDTSSKLTGKTSKGDEGLKSRSKNKTKPLTSNDTDDLKKFQDSRGSAPRECNDTLY